jgi:riboflavin synthase
MFTGLIQQKGAVRRLDRGAASGRIKIGDAAWDWPVQIGESIAVQGVCLTVTALEDDGFCFDVLDETFRRTNLGDKQAGDAVNLERALRQGDPLGGHMVQGHVDGTGRVAAIEPVDRDHRVRIACDAAILNYVVYKGSIAVDGISLTIADVDDESFTVHIIPHTWDVTTFSDLQVGTVVNVEADPLAKYVEKRLAAGGAVLPIDWAAVRAGGYAVLESGHEAD